MRLHKTSFFILSLMLLYCLSNPAVDCAERMVKKVVGKIQEILPGENQFLIGSTGSKDGSTLILQVQVDFDTKFISVKSLNDLKVNDFASVDFFQATGGKFIAEKIKFIPPAEDSNKTGQGG